MANLTTSPETISPWQAFLQNRRVQKMAFVLSVLIPMIIMFGAFYIYPLVDGFLGSLTDWRAFQPERTFIGFEHYRDLLADDTFRQATLNTLQYVLYYLPIMMVLALLIALGIRVTGRFAAFFRMVYFLPVVTSVIATALIWQFLYQPRYGLFNQLLFLIDLPPFGFLRDPDQALPSIAVYNVWKQLGFNIVLFLAGLSSIARVYYDAARVDGANAWQLFRYITMPLLRPTLLFVLITGMINTLQVFGPIYVMTSQTANDKPGGPLGSTLTLAVYQYQTAFDQFDLGKGAAAGILLFLLVLAVTILQGALLRVWRD